MTWFNLHIFIHIHLKPLNYFHVRLFVMILKDVDHEDRTCVRKWTSGAVCVCVCALSAKIASFHSTILRSFQHNTFPTHTKWSNPHRDASLRSLSLSLPQTSLQFLQSTHIYMDIMGKKINIFFSIF